MEADRKMILSAICGTGIGYARGEYYVNKGLATSRGGFHCDWSWEYSQLDKLTTVQLEVIYKELQKPFDEPVSAWNTTPAAAEYKGRVRINQTSKTEAIITLHGDTFVDDVVWKMHKAQEDKEEL